MCRQPFFHVCHRPDGLEDRCKELVRIAPVCHRPDGLEVNRVSAKFKESVCHRPDGLNITPLIINQINFQSNSK